MSSTSPSLQNDASPAPDRGWYGVEQEMPTPSFADDEERWAAVVDRDRSADGSFYYAVSTTGIFCRPGCASRRPARRNVRFFDSCEAALDAGFRPCRRCRPEGSSPDEERAALVARLCRRLESPDETPTLAELAAESGLSPWYLQRLFKATVGVTPKQYAAAHRQRRFRSSLAEGGARGSVTDAIYEAGFGSSSRAYEKAGERLGMTPSRYRRGGEGVVIRYAVAQCGLGRVLVAATERGLCAIELGDDAGSLRRLLEERFPAAELEEGDESFAVTVDAVVRLLERPSTGLDLPLDIQGTAFEERVWSALRHIPAGETLTYGELAERIGRRGAARAAARACATNRLAVAVPCHRVVRGDGGVGGYRWGRERKEALLRQEAAQGEGEDSSAAK